MPCNGTVLEMTIKWRHRGQFTDGRSLESWLPSFFWFIYLFLQSYTPYLHQNNSICHPSVTRLLHGSSPSRQTLRGRSHRSQTYWVLLMPGADETLRITARYSSKSELRGASRSCACACSRGGDGNTRTAVLLLRAPAYLVSDSHVLPVFTCGLSQTVAI